MIAQSRENFADEEVLRSKRRGHFHLLPIDFILWSIRTKKYQETRFPDVPRDKIWFWDVWKSRSHMIKVRERKIQILAYRKDFRRQFSRFRSDTSLIYWILNDQRQYENGELSHEDCNHNTSFQSLIRPLSWGGWKMRWIKLITSANHWSSQVAFFILSARHTCLKWYKWWCFRQIQYFY